MCCIVADMVVPVPVRSGSAPETVCRYGHRCVLQILKAKRLFSTKNKF